MTTKRNRTARFDIDRAQAHRIMCEAGARTLARVDGPNGSALDFYGTHRGCIVVQTFPDGGVTHYTEAPSLAWDDMRADAGRMMTPAIVADLDASERTA